MIKQTLSAQSRVKSDVKKLNAPKQKPMQNGWCALTTFTLGDHAHWSFIVLAANGFDLAPGVNASL